MTFFEDLSVNPFLASGLVASLLASICCGIVGPYIVVRRLVFLVGAIAHLALGGVGASLYLQYHFPTSFGWLDPLRGATLTAVFAAILLAWVEERARHHVDTLIGALWTSGMALGILLIKLTPGYHVELMSYLFGNLVFVNWSDVARLGVLTSIVVVTSLAFHKRFVALALDREQAQLQGVSPLLTQAILLVLVALTVITLTQIVGLILVIALLSLPAAAALRLKIRLPAVTMVAIGLTALLTTVPRIAVYETSMSPEPAIILAAAAVYAVFVAATRQE